jgi:hypothetical protein
MNSLVKAALQALEALYSQTPWPDSPEHIEQKEAIAALHTALDESFEDYGTVAAAYLYGMEVGAILEREACAAICQNLADTRNPVHQESADAINARKPKQNA